MKNFTTHRGLLEVQDPDARLAFTLRQAETELANVLLLETENDRDLASAPRLSKLFRRRLKKADRLRTRRIELEQLLRRYGR